jgi:hypothetical protein
MSNLLYDALLWFLQLFVTWCLEQAITATGTKKNDFILGEIHSQIKNKNVTLDIKTNSNSSVSLFSTLSFVIILHCFCYSLFGQYE